MWAACHTVLCWVLPLEEDEEMLGQEDQEEEEQEEPEEQEAVLPGSGLGERLGGLLEEVACCLSCQQPSEGLVLLVNRLRLRCFSPWTEVVQASD